MSSEPAKIATAQAQVDRAQSDLTAALESGSDTSQIRRDLAAAETRLAALMAEPKATPATQAAELEPVAVALAEQAAGGIRASIESLAAIELPAIAGLLFEARRLIEARREHAMMQAQAQERQARTHALRGRLAALQDERQATITRRLKGDCRPDDAAVIALLDADIEGVGGLIARAESGPLPATPSLGTAERAWNDAAESARQRALSALVERLQTALLAAVDALGDAPFAVRPMMHKQVMAAASKGGKW